MEIVFINCHLNVCFVSVKPTLAKHLRRCQVCADSNTAVLAAFPPEDLAAAVWLRETCSIYLYSGTAPTE